MRVVHDYDGAPADLMVALHAWRSSEAIDLYRRKYRDRPLIVALVGTDVYQYIDSDPEPTVRSLRNADKLVGLHENIAKRIPEEFRDKLTIIRQSADPPPAAEAQHSDAFDVAVIGHLRDVKDPLRAAIAARALPPQSRIRIVHLGAAMSPNWEVAAQREMESNPRYVWRGEVSHEAARQTLAISEGIVLSSLSEGGANVVSEAAVSGVPVVSSRIDAVVALLGEDYPGFFPVGDTATLTRLLHRLETDATFAAKLRSRLSALRSQFAPAAELESWRTLIESPTR